MRYKEEDVLAGYQMAQHSSDGMLLLTAVMGFFIGFILFYLGRLGKQMWMWVWGIGLVIASFAMGLVTWLNLPA